MAEPPQPSDATTALEVAASDVVSSPIDAKEKRGCTNSERDLAEKEHELVAAKKIRIDKKQDEKESDTTKNHSVDGNAPSMPAARAKQEGGSLEKEYEEEEEDEEEAFDFLKYIVGRDDWLKNAKNGITAIGKLSAKISLSIFYEDELEGSMPEETVNLTRGMVDEDIVNGIVIGLHDSNDDSPSKGTGKITGLQIGVAGGGTPGASNDEVDTAKEAVDWLLREGGGGDESKKADLFVRFWPWNIQGDGDDWVDYSEDFNDLEKVGLLQGFWYDDCEKVARQDLERVVQELWDTLEGTMKNPEK